MKDKIHTINYVSHKISPQLRYFIHFTDVIVKIIFNYFLQKNFFYQNSLYSKYIT